MSDPKQVIVVRKDLNMRKGKMVAQGAHASMAAILNLGHIMDGMHEFDDMQYLCIPLNNHTERWLLGGKAVPPSGFKKICVSCDDEAELLELAVRCVAANIPHALIKDNGLTEFGGVPTYTALAVGPSDEETVNAITGHLKLL